MAVIHFDQTAPDAFNANPRPKPYDGPIFKYMKREFAEAFLPRGIVKIGTVREYQDIEKYGTAIGDDWEGRSKISHYGSLNGQLAQQLTAPYKSRIVNCHSYVPGPSLSVGSHSHDYYIYCATKEVSREAMNAFKCDTCVIIENYRRVFHLICEVLEKGFDIRREFEACSVTYDQKHYSSSERRSLDGRPEWLLKEQEYAYQKEFRARWSPKASRTTENLPQLPPVEVTEIRYTDGIRVVIRD